MTVKQVPIHKDNHEPRPVGYRIEGIVIHIMQGTLKGTDGWFGGENIASGVYSSTQEGIGKNGEVHVYLEPSEMAYHVGRVNAPVWAKMKKTMFGYDNPNKYTYGIENEGYRGDKWTEEQMVALCERVKLIAKTAGLPITRETIISHNEITADKEDMRSWCDEIVRRLTSPSTPQPSKEEIKNQIKALVDLL
jgi:N-acetyl-anhydromuramyl-L-alanine amidase AmpD